MRLLYLDPNDHRLVNARARDTDDAMSAERRAELLGRLVDFMCHCSQTDHRILAGILDPDNDGLSMQAIRRKVAVPERTFFRRLTFFRKVLYTE